MAVTGITAAEIFAQPLPLAVVGIVLTAVLVALALLPQKRPARSGA